MQGKIIISLVDLAQDHPQFKIEIENNSCRVTLNYYGDYNDLKRFGLELLKFPKSISDSVIFQIGEDNRQWAYYLNINALCYDLSGHTALRIVLDYMSDTINGYRTTFTIFSEAASINSLGEKLVSWNPLAVNELVWESKIS